MDLLGQRSTMGHHYDTINVVGGSAQIGDRYVTINHLSEDEHLRRRRQFLDSLRYPEMNARYNEIKEAAHGTYQWVFGIVQEVEPGNNSQTSDGLDHDHAKRELRSLTQWLRLGQGLYYVEGKPGSGKSTFMKFLYEHATTAKMLSDWSKGRSLKLLFHSFWRAGSKIQQSWKGFLANLLYQLVSKDPSLVFRVDNAQIDLKHNIHDWSEKELYLKLRQLCAASQYSLCIFVDGIDEFDPEDDGDKVVDLLNWISEEPHIKLCVSSRPDDSLRSRLHNTSSIRLQDINESDIYTYVRGTLERKLAKYSPLQSLAHEGIDWRKRLASLICDKADGVFIWVRCVLNEVWKGIEDEDHLKDLYQRIEALPSKIIDLYKEMWFSANGNSIAHQRQTLQVFSLVHFFPLTLFHVLLVLEPDIRKNYMTHLTRQDPIELQNQCRRMAKVVRRRSAGLIECVTSEYYTLYPPDRVSILRLVDLSVNGGHLSPSPRLKVQCIHRTVVDFLAEYQQEMLSITDEKPGSVAATLPLIEAYIAGCVEGIFDQSTLDAVRMMVSLLYQINEDSMPHVLSQIRSQCIRLSTTWEHHHFSLMEAEPLSIETIQSSKNSDDVDRTLIFQTLWPSVVVDVAPIPCVEYVINQGISQQMWSSYYIGYVLFHSLSSRRLLIRYEPCDDWERLLCLISAGPDWTNPHADHVNTISDGRLNFLSPLSTFALRVWQGLMYSRADYLTSDVKQAMLAVLKQTAGSQEVHLTLVLRMRFRDQRDGQNPRDRLLLDMPSGLVPHARYLLWMTFEASEFCSVLAEILAEDSVRPFLMIQRLLTSISPRNALIASQLFIVRKNGGQVAKSCPTWLLNKLIQNVVADDTELVVEAEIDKFLEDDTQEWTKLEQFGHIRFNYEPQPGDILPLDPQQEVGSRDWRKFCKARGYFARVAREEAEKQRLQSSQSRKRQYSEEPGGRSSKRL